ncbi:MAG TPA: phospholipase D-like domain-containing protein [archaeon]|nr:phospholipase D-like domain-containing protein [archaeon]
MNKLQKINIGIILSIILIIITIFGVIYLNLYKPEIPQYHFDYNNLYYSEENIEIYILPNQKALDRVIEILTDANKEIHCTLRSLNYEELENTFIEKEKTTKVRLFINEDYMGNKNIYLPYVKFEDRNHDTNGMMHNNYCIIDQEIVIAGSIIFNENTIHSNVHDVIIIKSKDLAKEYNSDFWRLYNDQNFVEQQTPSYNEIQINDNTIISPHFCPVENCEIVMDNEFSKSNSTIKAAVYLFTNNKMINTVKYKKDVEKKIIIEPYGLTRDSIVYEKIPGVKISHLVEKVHTKLITIDDNISISGTMSPTYFGVNWNQENFLIIKNKNINKFYNELIDYLYQKTKPN